MDEADGGKGTSVGIKDCPVALAGSNAAVLLLTDPACSGAHSTLFKVDAFTATMAPFAQWGGSPAGMADSPAWVAVVNSRGSDSVASGVDGRTADIRGYPHQDKRLRGIAAVDERVLAGGLASAWYRSRRRCR